jgi:hypothetical protein
MNKRNLFKKFYFNNISKTMKSSELLKNLKIALNKKENDNSFSLKGKENYFAAKYLYENFTGEIIATAFNENPYYGEKDLALKYNGKSFSRITSSNACNKESIENLCKQYNNKEFNLTIIPQEKDFTKIGGMFLKCSDNSYLSFISLHHPNGNIGLIITDELAKIYFDYYESLKNLF